MRREIKRFLANQHLLAGAEQNADAELFLELVRIEAGLIVARGTDETGETLYGFVHQTFQEYFAAVDVIERYQQEDDSKIIRNFLKDHLHEPHWREVILLLFGKLKHKFATAQLRGILEGKSRLSN
jgi:predicted NACHT family NTPase